MPAVQQSRLASFGKQIKSGLGSDNEKVPQSGRNDLIAERSNASFDPRQMNYFVHGGKETVLLREKFLLEFERDPTFRNDDFYDLTKSEQRERVMTRLRSVIHFINNESQADYMLRLQVLILIDPGFLTRLAVHYGLFLNTIMGQGTPEQVAFWLGKGAADFKGVIGCYAMTELGHGSNVAGLETVAVFDHDSDEFVIHSPTLTSTKWWIGGAAESATHSTVFANLIVDGKNYGVKPFVVQVRDPESYALAPGVTIGDCGSKMGRNAIDNGWIQFTHVRIPRTNMLMRYTKVSRHGKVNEPPMAQLAYGALILGRTSIIRESVECAKKAVTIAVRYGCVRRQFGKANESTPDRPLEIKIIDYQTHQQRLIPQIALTYAMAFGAMRIGKKYDDLMKILDKTKTSDPNIMKVIESLKEIHATSAGLKALCTWSTLEMIEKCRQTLGGLGYSSYAGLATLFQDFAVQCTWEGDNTVLTLQTGRYLINCVNDKTVKSKTLPEGVAHLNQLPLILSKKYTGGKSFADLKVITEALDVTCANLAVRAAKEYKSLLQKGLSKAEAQLQCSVQKFEAAKLHSTAYLFKMFKEAVADAPDSLQEVLGDLCCLYGLNSIKENAGCMLQYGYIQAIHMEQIDNQILNLFVKLRPQVVPLTDSFGLTDFSLNSPLGAFDGDVYRRMFERVKLSSPHQTHPYFERVIKPVLLRKDQKTEIIKLEE